MVLYRNSGGAQVKPRINRDVDEKLFIGTLGVNCLEFTRRCIDTVATACKSVRFVYIDNGSKEENVAAIKEWKKNNQCIDDFLIGANGYNAGVAVGWNQLIKMALEWGATKIIICNNDIAFGPHTIDGLVQAYNKLRKEIPETVMVTAANRTKSPAQLSSIRQEWRYQEHPDFSCFMITPETIERIGFFCEDYQPAFFEDNDMHWRILMMGYKAFSTDWAPYSHIASRTRFGNPNIVPHAQFRLNRVKFYRNMLTTSVDQEIPAARYNKFIADNPHIKHPTPSAVISHAVKTGLIDPKLIEKLNNIPEEALVSADLS